MGWMTRGFWFRGDSVNRMSLRVGSLLGGRGVRFGIHVKFILTIVLLIILTSIIMSWFFIKREVDLIQTHLKLKGGTLVDFQFNL